MILELTEEQSKALQIPHLGPTSVVDPRTRQSYILLTLAELEQLQALNGDSLADTYQVQIESALAAGWSDPEMDEYNDYDAHRKARP